MYYFAVCELVYDGAKGGPYDRKQAHPFLSYGVGPFCPPLLMD